jgi:hypothetical protein
VEIRWKLDLIPTDSTFLTIYLIIMIHTPVWWWISFLKWLIPLSNLVRTTLDNVFNMVLHTLFIIQLDYRVLSPEYCELRTDRSTKGYIILILLGTAMKARASENYLSISSKSVEIFWVEIYLGRLFFRAESSLIQSSCRENIEYSPLLDN